VWLRILIVSEHEVFSSCDNLTQYVVRVFALDFHFHAVDGSSAGTGHEVVPVGEGDQRCALSGAIANGDGEAYADKEVFDLFR
jgi:hypothetical protein